MPTAPNAKPKDPAKEAATRRHNAQRRVAKTINDGINPATGRPHTKAFIETLPTKVPKAAAKGS